MVLVHRLVAELFIPNPGNRRTVNHKNGDKADNRVENLEWATHAEQQIHCRRVLGKCSGAKHWNAKLTQDEVTDIRVLRTFGATQQALADAFGISRTGIDRILNHKTWLIQA